MLTFHIVLSVQVKKLARSSMLTETSLRPKLNINIMTL